MGTLTLNDGTILHDSSGLVSSGNLFIYVRQDGISMTEVFNAFIDPEKTERIVYTQVNAEEIVFTGYEKLSAVRDEGDGLCTAVLIKG